MGKSTIRILADILALGVMMPLLIFTACAAQKPAFHDAPASVQTMKNPYAGQPGDTAKTTYHVRCANCHGENGEGMGNVPALATGATQSATDGEIFWYITKGDAGNGMPSWETLSTQERWKIISFLRVLGNPNHSPSSSHFSLGEALGIGAGAPPSDPPFTDYRFERPGTFRKITLNDLPAPFATSSAGNGPEVVPRPEKAWPQVPSGFKVDVYANGLDEPRLIRTAPNGDVFVA